jgi:hypothetical protein
MSGFDLPNNYTDNLEALLMKRRSRATSSLLHWQVNQSPPNHPLLPLWPRQSITTLAPLLPMCLLGLLSTQGLETLSCALA